MISGTIEPMGTMLAGQNVEAFYLSIQHLNPLTVGLELRHRSGIHAGSPTDSVRVGPLRSELLPQCGTSR